MRHSQMVVYFPSIHDNNNPPHDNIDPPPMMLTELRSTTFGYHGNESLPCRQEDEEEGEGGEEEG